MSGATQTVNSPVKELHKSRILLKLSGEIFLDKSREPSIDLANSLAEQIIQLKDKFYFAIVIGGGNFFRGSQDSKLLNLSKNYGHYIGMLATQMNSLILKECFEKNGLNCKILSALPSPTISTTLSQNEIDEAAKKEVTIIFAGGNGTPYFSTDTTSIIRALQFNAKEIWKGTKTEGVYDMDPNKNRDAVFLKRVTYQEAIDKKLKIMDACAFTLAEENNLKIRVFNVFEKDSLLKVAETRTSDSKTFGTIIIKG
jgi:uridylate kinase